MLENLSKNELLAKRQILLEKVKAIRAQATIFDNIQMAKKIQLNSAYGALGNPYFRWFNPDFAEAITLGGQLSIRWIETKLNQLLNKMLKTTDVDYVIAVDTDSVYLRLADVVKVANKIDKPVDEIVSFLDDFCAKMIEPRIDKYYEELAEYVNAFDQKMFMKREAIASRGIWTGKKRYILNVYNNEGVSYTEPKLKVMGMEAVRSSTPAVCRDKIKGAMKIMISGKEEELRAYVADFKKEFKSLPFEAVAFPRGLNGIKKYSDKVTRYKKGTPIHVKGAISYNHLIKDRKLSNENEFLNDGDKLKFCYLKMPNPAKVPVISCPVDLPKGLSDLADYIDYNTQFEKAFLRPLESIAQVIDWQMEVVETLDEFFTFD